MALVKLSMLLGKPKTRECMKGTYREERELTGVGVGHGKVEW